MPLKPKQVRWITGVGLAIVTLLTRIPFHARTLFEFDSIDFAVATFRFSLEQVTPHMPGYIGHVLLGRCFTLFTADVNQAFVWLSTVLSVFSVLFMWRAGANLCGERVGVIAAVLWLFTPLFWFYGEVATAYIHEALFASLILYLALKLLREPHNEWLLIGLAVALSLSGSMRQNSIIFFLPVIAYVTWKTRQPWKRIGIALVAFVAVTFAWINALLHESGGLQTYLYYAGKESIFKSQSVLFGNAVSVHLAVIGKMLFYLAIACLPIIALAAWYLLIKKEAKLVDALREALGAPQTWVLLLAALPALAFYALIYFMKAGYLLNVLPSIVLFGAVLIDELAIAYAWRKKLQPSNQFALTRPIITWRAIVITAIVSGVNILWFTLPLPGKDHQLFVDGSTAVSFGNDLSDRVKLGSSADRLLNRAFAYTSLQGVQNVDRINESVTNTLRSHAKPNSAVLDTWWSRWGYFYMPEVRIYDIITLTDSLQMGVSLQHDRVPVMEKEIDLSERGSVILLIRPDHPDLKLLSQQAALEPIDPLLGIYHIRPKAASIQWKDKTFRF